MNDALNLARPAWDADVEKAQSEGFLTKLRRAKAFDNRQRKLEMRTGMTPGVRTADILLSRMAIYKDAA